MATGKELLEWRDRLAAATGDPPPDDPMLGADLKTALGYEIEGDPTHEILAAIELCEACGLQWVEVSSANDIQFVKHPDHEQGSGFHIHIGNAALAMCRGIVAELWLAHPERLSR